MLWRVYFVALAVLNAPTFLLQDYTRNEDIANALVFAVCLVGLYGFVWEKTVISRRFWQVFVPAFILWEALYHYFVPKSSHHVFVMQQLHLPVNTVSALCVLVLLPALNALWRYAYEMKRLWDPFLVPAYLRQRPRATEPEAGRHDDENWANTSKIK